MSLKDYAYTNGTAYTEPSNPDTPPWVYDLENINDNDNSSYAYLGSGGSSEGYRNVGVTLDKARYIEQIKFITKWDGSGIWTIGFWLQYYDGSWKTLYSQGITQYFTEGKTTRTYSAGYSNVSKIRVRAYMKGQSPTGAQGYIYTEALLGQYYPDSGMRVQGPSGIISIGKDTILTGHKLRFSKDGSIYAIPLLDPASPYASPLRIYDGSGVKALSKIMD